MELDPSSRCLSVVNATLYPRRHGGIIGLLDSWKASGLGDRIDLVQLSTSAWDDSRPLQLVQVLRAMLQMLWLVAVPSRRPDLVLLHASMGGSLHRKLALSRADALRSAPARLIRDDDARTPRKAIAALLDRCWPGDLDAEAPPEEGCVASRGSLPRGGRQGPPVMMIPPTRAGSGPAR